MPVNFCVTEQNPRFEISTKCQVDDYVKAVSASEPITQSNKEKNRDNQNMAKNLITYDPKTKAIEKKLTEMSQITSNTTSIME